MRKWLPLLLLLLSSLVLAACASGPRKYVFPPEARLQELRRADDGSWHAVLRLHNYSTVPMRFERVEARLRIDDHATTTLALPLDLLVAASSVELVEAALTPSADAAARLDAALAARSGVAYRIEGSIRSSEPRGNYRFEFASRLDPVPGLHDTLR